MPQWLLEILVSLGVKIIERFGVPYLEAKYPALIPILSDILKVINGVTPVPSEELHQVASYYAKGTVAIPTALKEN